MAFFRIGRFGGGRPNSQPLVLLTTALSSFITLESSFFDFLLTEDGLFIVT
jgi:hypothetical protein